MTATNPLKPRREPHLWREVVFTSMVSPAAAAATMEHLASSAELGMVTFEMRCRGGSNPRWHTSAHPAQINAVSDALAAHLPVHVHEQRSPRRGVRLAARAHFKGANPHLNPDRIEDAARAVFSVAANLKEDQELVLQLMVGQRYGAPVPDKDTWVAFFEALLTGGRPSKRRESISPSLRRRAGQHGFAASIRIGATASTDNIARSLVARVRSGLKVMEASGTRIVLTNVPANRLDKAQRPWRWPLRITSGEAAGVVGWPTGQGALPAFGGGHPRLVPPPRNTFPTERQLGTPAAPGFTGNIGIPIADAAYHSHFLGPTGVGKSTALLNLIAADIQSGRSVCVIDQKGDLAQDLLEYIPQERLDDVVVLDAFSNHSLGLNPLNGPKGMEPQTADALLHVFESMESRPFGVQVRQAFSTAIHTLTRAPGATLLWLEPLMTNPAFRKRVLDTVEDTTGLEYWGQFEALTPAKQQEAVGPVLRRLHPFMMRRSLRGILGQAEPQFDIRDLFLKRKILIVNGNKARVGAEPAKLLGNLLIGLLWQHALTRSSLPKEKRHVVSVVIDEAQDFLGSFGGDLSEVLAMSRSLGLGMILAHQFLKQLNPEMQEAISVNTRNKVIFALNGQDSTTMAKQADGLEAADFALLPAYHAHANLMSQGRQTGWMTLKLNPAPKPISDAAEVYARAQSNYTVSAMEVEERYQQALEKGGSRGSGKRAKSAKTSSADSGEAPQFGRRRT